MSETFLVFSDDWGGHPSSCQHLFKRISRKNRVIWVNTIMRMPSFSLADFKKIFSKLCGSKKSDEGQVECPVTAIRPLMVPMFNRLGRYINKKLLVRQLRSYLKKERVESFIVVTTLPIVADVVSKLGAQKIVYYCVDEFSEWPGHNRDQMKNMEADLLPQADVVITTSNTLFEAKKPFVEKIHCLPHGVDISHFSNVEPQCADEFSHPMIGYYGLFDERSDLSLIEYILSNRPDWHIMVVGEVRGDVSALRKYPNMHFYGKLSYDQLPAVVNGFDICILPYNVDALTHNINPLKFKEYLATGLPVVTTALPDLKQYSDVIGWAQTAEQFVGMCESFLNQTDQQRKQRIDQTKKYLEGQSWDDKARAFLSYIENAGHSKRS